MIPRSILLCALLLLPLPAQDVLIENLRRIHTGAGEILEAGSILVQDGKITAVGSDVSAPAGITVIDGSKLEASPGIIDAHSHIAIEGGVNEGSLVVTPEVRIRDVLTSDSPSMYRSLAGGTTAAHCMHGSANVIGGQNETIKLKWKRPIEELLIEDAPRTVKFALGENPKRSNSRSRRRGARRFPATRMGVEAVLREAFDGARAYRQARRDHRAAEAEGKDPLPPRRDLRKEALVEILEGKIHVHVHCYRADEMLMMLQIAERYGFRVKVLHHVLEGYRVAPEIAAHGAGASTFADWWAYKIEAYDATPYNAAIMAQAGVLVSIKSDSADHIRRLNVEAAKTIKYGDLSPEEALALVTLNPAKQLGIGHRTGSLEVGKDADIALWNGDPLSTFSRVEKTFVEGELLFDRERDRKERPEIFRFLETKAGGGR